MCIFISQTNREEGMIISTTYDGQYLSLILSLLVVYTLACLTSILVTFICRSRLSTLKLIFLGLLYL